MKGLAEFRPDPERTLLRRRAPWPPSWRVRCL